MLYFVNLSLIDLFNLKEEVNNGKILFIGGAIMAKFCSHCGKEIDEQADVCIHCGVKIVKGEPKDPNAKSKIAAGLLGILLGWVGAHNFYLGYTGKAVGQLLITLLSCFTLAFVSAIWGLIEGILILAGNIDTDANGNKLAE